MKLNSGIPSAASMPVLVEDSERSQDETVLASYSGEAFQRSGIRLSVDQQCRLFNMFDTDICKGHYRRNVNVPLSIEDEAVFKQPGHGADTYGEIMPESFLEVLWRSGATSRERFYDLGSGTGKLAAIAWLTGMRATGIELSRARSELAWQMQARLESRFAEASKSTEKCSFPKIRTGGLKYLCGSIFDVDFTDADVVFFSSVMFNKYQVSRVATIARWMKPGSRIISFHDLSNLGADYDFPEFKLLGEIYVATSWKAESCWFVHEVVDNPPEGELRPQDLIHPNNWNG